MWEGLIYIKANNATMQDRHRQRMEITKKELKDLTEANDYDKIFSDYFNTFSAIRLMMWLMVCRTGMAFLTAGITAIRAKRLL